MKLIKPSIQFQQGVGNCQAIEQTARTCYKSKSPMTEDSAKDMVSRLIARKHDAMLEFGWMQYKIVCDRGVTHEIVRHRLFSFAQESTRYCNYKDGVTFIIPSWTNLEIAEYSSVANGGGFISYKKGIKFEPEPDVRHWLHSLHMSAGAYQDLITYSNWTPQKARSVLPNALKTEIHVAGNFREWRHFFKLRCAESAHPQMREVAELAMLDAVERFPGIFNDILEKEIAKRKRIKD